MLGGGAGSILEMIIRLRENRKLLRKKSYFKDGDNKFESDKHIVIQKIRTVDHRKSSPQLLRAIQSRILRESTVTRNKQIILIGLLTVVIFSVVAHFIIQSHRASKASIPEFNSDRIKEEVQSEQELYDMYLYYIKDAESWMQKRKWHNASFQYHKALGIYPNHVKTQIKLANALMLQCELEGAGCFESYNFVQNLVNQYPNNSDITTLKERWNSNHKLLRNASFSIH